MNSYFSHDSNARNSDELIKIRMKYKAAGYGVYFMILERLRDSENYMSIKDYNLIAFDLREDASLIKSIVEDFGLFVFTDDGKYFYSEGLRKRMGLKDEIKSKRSEAGKKGMANRWNKKTESDCNKTITNDITKDNKVITNDIENDNNKSKVNNSKEKESISNDIPKKAELSPHTDKIDYSGLRNYFNSMFKDKLPLITTIDKKRQAAIRARASEHGKESIDKVLKAVLRSSFLLGRNDKNWRADFDWIFKPTNYVKILEGNYNDKQSITNTGTGFKSIKLVPREGEELDEKSKKFAEAINTLQIGR